MKDNILTVKVREATKTGYAVARGGRDSVNFSMPGSKTRRGRVGMDIANTLDTSCNQGIFVQISEELTVYAVWYPKKQCYVAIRKLTPKSVSDCKDGRMITLKKHNSSILTVSFISRLETVLLFR